MSVWSDVLIGLAFVAGGYWLIKTIYQWNRFRRSIYIEIYSSYFEYAFRRKNLVRLSESFYLNNEFGKHKIFYQIAQDKNEKTPQAYILILLPSGIYVLNVKNQRKGCSEETWRLQAILHGKREEGTGGQTA